MRDEPLKEFLGFLAEFAAYVVMLFVILLRPKDTVAKFNRLLERILIRLTHRRK